MEFKQLSADQINAHRDMWASAHDMGYIDRGLMRTNTRMFVKPFDQAYNDGWRERDREILGEVLHSVLG